jgi:endonuclease/exonuclease/phosphatase (EEP) superfamily protein YafD
VPRAPRQILRTFILWFVAATFAACIAAAALLLAGPERVPWLADVAYLPYPVFLGPALVALGLSLGLRWPWRAAALASVMLVALVIMDFTFATGDRGTPRVRLMTFNVKDYETLLLPDGAARIEREVARYDPDILVMQDAGRLFGSVEKGAIFRGRHSWSSGEFVVVSRHPLAGCEELVRPLRGRRLHHVHCEVRSPDWRLHVHVVHLLSPRHGLGALRSATLEGLREWDDNVDMRMEQARALASVMSAAAHPSVIAGDFNAPAHSLVLRELQSAGYRDAFTHAGRGFGFTYGHALRTGFSFLRLDHVMVDASVGIADCFVAPQGVSPHRAVIADLTLRPAS